MVAPALLIALSLLVGLAGLAAALALPFAPVLAEQATVSWPAPGRPASSSTAFLTPYRPAGLSATVPCSALLAAAARGRPTTVLATGGSTDVGGGLLVRVDGGRTRLLLNGRQVATAPASAREGGCDARVDAGPAGVTVSMAGRTDTLAGEPVPEVAAFRTDLDPAQASGLAVTARTVNPFGTSPGALKKALLAVQLLAAALALGLLARSGATVRPRVRWPRVRWPRVRWRPGLVDAGVLATLAGWAVVGPLSDDDGFATMIARNSALAGDQGNYYRWWNASEAPFALAQHVLAPLTEVSLAPLWLRLPSTLLGAATWFVLSRGVLGAVPELRAGRARMRLLAAVCFLCGWLPYDLGVRPEPYVALGLTTVLALLWRARGQAALGAATLVAALTVTASPSGLLVAAPALLFVGKIGRILTAGRSGSRAGRWDALALLALLAAIGGVGLTAVFADQSMDGMVAATRWHAEFSPSLPWHLEVQRYRFLLGEYQDGNATKRVPVLLTLALLPVLGLMLARPDPAEPRDPRDGAAGRLGGCVLVALALLWLTPSKWTLYFGALAGLFAAFLVVSVVVLVRRALGATADRVRLGIGLVGGGLVAVAAGLAFAGTNDWWQPTVYAVPWAAGPVRPAGLALDWPPLWAGAALAGVALVRWRHGADRARRALVAAPGVLVIVVAATSVVLLGFSFVSAPLRQPSGSLALANLHRLTGTAYCGLADDIQALPDTPGGVLTPAEPGPGRLDGFAAGAGYRPDHPPPDPPGVLASAQLWGSWRDGALGTGELVSPWFTLPALGRSQELALTVSGRIGAGNALALEFGRAEGGGAGVATLAERAPVDRPHNDPSAPPERALWRSVWLGPDQVPAGADRVRVRAVDGTSDPDGWLALTGPRLREVVGLTDFLAGHGPVLVNWPVAFLFPCVRDVVGVAHGLAGAPRAMIEAAGRYAGLAAATTEPEVGANFAALRTLGRLGEVPTRLVGHPGADWGSLRLADYPADRDTYRLDLIRVPAAGWSGR